MYKHLMKGKKKLVLKSWVNQLLYVILLLLFVYLLFKYNLIGINKKTIDITKTIILLVNYELIKKIIKNLKKQYFKKIEF